MIKHLVAILGALWLLAALPDPVTAQQTALVVSSCGSQTLIAGRYYAISQDTTGDACGNGGGGGGGSNAAAGATGSAVPASAGYTGYADASGNLIGASAAHPLPAATVASIYSTGQITVANTATVIAAARTGGRPSLTICVPGTVAVFLGTSSVTTSIGEAPGWTGGSTSIAGACRTYANMTAAVYGIVGTGTAVVTESETLP